jgi:predicted transcriptional regulator
MAVKKGILDEFLKPSSHYRDNQKNFRSIFIDKNEENIQPNIQDFFKSPPPFLSSNVIKEPEIKRVQTGGKLGTNWGQTGDKQNAETKKVDSNWVQTGYESGDAFEDKLGTNRVQTGYKNKKTVFTELYGIQREIIICLCQLCKKTRSKITEPITIEYLTLSLNRTYNSVKTSIKRLERKGCITRVNFKNGRGGWSKYEISECIYHEAIQHETGDKLRTNRGQTEDKLGAEVGTELGTTVSSSSSYLNLKETTTSLSNEWNFDITPYARLGFTQTQIKQLAALGSISPAEVEQSLIEFSYDIDNNKLPPIKTSKINFLMGLLRSGHSYTSEGFKNEQDALVLEMASRAETKRKNLLEAKFVMWESNLDQEERKKIESKLSVPLMVLYRTYGLDNTEVKNHFFNYYLQKCLV